MPQRPKHVKDFSREALPLCQNAGAMPIRIFALQGQSDTLTEPTPADLPLLLAREDVVVWVDLLGEDAENEQLLTDVFKFHPLVIEDAFQDAPHPKIEEFDTYLYLIVRGIDTQHSEPKHLKTAELDIFLGKNFVVTHHSGNVEALEQSIGEIKRQPKVMRRGSAMLMHLLLDRVTDLYLPLIAKFDDAIEDLESAVLKSPDKKTLEDILALKSALQKIRRLGIHQLEVLDTLSSGDIELIPRKWLPFFRDVYDHFVRVTDLADSHRELLSGVLAAYMGEQQARLNNVMKVLTLISTIMLPLTFIAGIYGMNFDPDTSRWNMPELRWLYGYPFALGLMTATAAGLVWLFKKRGWFD